MSVEASLRTTYGLFIVVINHTCQGKVLETEDMVVDYCNTNGLKLVKGLENLSEEFVKNLKHQSDE